MKKHLRISFNGKTYDVVAEVLENADVARTVAVPVVSGGASAAVAPGLAPPPAGSSSAAANVGDLPSPIAGKVVSIEATVGARVDPGQPVITLEAMKMNTVVSAPSGGTITAVHVAVGDSVEEGRLLVTIG
jgi:glutaconyl-CoA/methylmalonyl-CoA decarboxylase subunit gamma